MGFPLSSVPLGWEESPEGANEFSLELVPPFPPPKDAIGGSLMALEVFDVALC